MRSKNKTTPALADRSAYSAWLGPQQLPWLLVGIGLACMYLPTFVTLFQTIWTSDKQGQGPIVLGLSVWLVWRKWGELISPDSSEPAPRLGWTIIVLAGATYVVGRVLSILLFEVGAMVPLLIGVVVLLHGYRRLRVVWFPLFFMLFMIPLPAPIIDSMTQPMKLAVSSVSEHILYWAGYPIARTGVILQIGQYRLLVADACAGLHTLFVLEAMGLLYLNVVQSSSAIRNIALAILVVPISFMANSIRVIVLILLTYYFGDEVGQGFLHGFAGMLLFVSALLLLILIDSLLRAGSAVIRKPARADGGRDAR
ncbi:exosortase B [Hydrocarboniphaga sp.]|uniref:exosortase B n=1 Tax=Hydrocarboniphaga sp. TaxID=2033016 RepID=UPI003D0E29C7